MISITALVVGLFKGDQRPIITSVSSSILGQLVYSNDEKCWITAEQNARLPFQISIAGNWGKEFPAISPDLQLIEHAESIARAAESFLADVARYIRSEIVNCDDPSGWAEEVAQLKVSTLILHWVERPNDGMIYFEGPDQFRVWRCDYINRKPSGLGFDS